MIFMNFIGILPIFSDNVRKSSFFSFYSAFYAPIWVKNIVLSYEGKNVIAFHTCWKSI